MVSWKLSQRSISNLIKQLNSEDKAREIKRKIVRINIMRGKGIFCRSIMEAQLASTDKTNLYALFISLINIEVCNYNLFNKTRYSLIYFGIL